MHFLWRYDELMSRMCSRTCNRFKTVPFQCNRIASHRIYPFRIHLRAGWFRWPEKKTTWTNYIRNILLYFVAIFRHSLSTSHSHHPNSIIFPRELQSTKKTRCAINKMKSIFNILGNREERRRKKHKYTFLSKEIRIKTSNRKEEDRREKKDIDATEKLQNTRGNMYRVYTAVCWCTTCMHWRNERASERTSKRKNEEKKKQLWLFNRHLF